MPMRTVFILFLSILLFSCNNSSETKEKFTYERVKEDTSSVQTNMISNNIVLKFFSSVYVEMFRNIPLLIHLFFWYFAVLRAVPGKREKIDVLGSYAGINVTGLYLPKPLFFDGSTIFLFSIFNTL